MKRNGKIHGIHFKIYVQHEYIGDIHVLGIMNGNITIRSYLLTLLNGLANNEQNIFRLNCDANKINAHVSSQCSE